MLRAILVFFAVFLALLFLAALLGWVGPLELLAIAVLAASMAVLDLRGRRRTI